MNNRRTALHFANWLGQLFRDVASKPAMDRLTRQSTFFAGLLVLITTLLVVVYYMNNPQPLEGPDSFEYIANAQRIATQGQLVDPHRLPGFPLLIALVFALAGQGNIMAVSIANAVLFILATLEIYIITLLVLQQRWLAFLIGLLVGTNVVLLSFIKPIGSEGLALWLVVSLALVAVVFVRTLRIRYLWMVTACTLGLFLTRLEWMYLPVPLFAYLVLVAVRQGSPLRHLLMHALVSVVLLYAVLAGYIFINATQYHFVGVTDIQNINAWGKVLQYDMQNEAPPKYAELAQITNTYRSHGGLNPYDLLEQYPRLKSNHFALVGAYAQSIILHHPQEFLAKSVPVAFLSLHYFYYESEINPQGRFAGLLAKIELVFHILYKLNMGFPLCAGVWLLLLCWRSTARLLSVQAMGVLLLLVLYGIVLTTLGGYSSYTRFHTSFNPLLILILWGSPLAGLRLVVPRGLRGVAYGVPSKLSKRKAKGQITHLVLERKASMIKGNKILMLVENVPVPMDPRVWSEATALRDHGFQVCVICPKGTTQHRESYTCIENIHIYRYQLPQLNHSNIAYVVEYSLAMLMTFCLSFKVLFRHGFDVIHAANPPDLFFMIGLFYRIFGKKFVFDQHDLTPEIFRVMSKNRIKPLYKLLLLLEKWTYQTAHLVIVANASFKQIAIKRGGCPANKVFVVRNGPNLERMKSVTPEPELKGGRRYLLAYVGVMAVQDGVEYALYALDELVHKRNRQDVSLVLMGDGDNAATLRRLAHELSLDAYVNFTGWLELKDILRYLTVADIGLSPDARNGLNEYNTTIKIMEYMAMGKPIVAFDLPETRFSARNAALYATPNLAEDFAKNIETLLDDEELRLKMGANGRKRIEEELSWDYSKNYLLLAYEKLFSADFQTLVSDPLIVLTRDWELVSKTIPK